jgi:peroxiredoxin family protein
MTKNAIIMFSGDFDKAMAGMIIANGAAAMGNEVTVFFTFWGLNLLRKPDKVAVKKSFMDKMFGGMMPRGPEKAKLSKMGWATGQMKKTMKRKHVQELSELMKQARDMGVKFIACTMSMDVMGMQKEELLDGLEFAGVATYIGEADESTITLFI